MYLRPMLGLGQKGSLAQVCRWCRIPLVNAHRAADDALASAYLWDVYLDACAAQGVRTFQELAKLKKYKFTESWLRAPLTGPGLIAGSAAVSLLKPRA
jgi:DNA polymerase III alpha subunit (gram-positive type)